MQMEYLREFVVFAQTMNFTTAAKKLFMAQPTLSQHIHKLEDSLGFTLVKRTNPLTLTPEGEVFLPRIQRILHDYDDMIAACYEAQTAQSVPPIRIAGFQAFITLPPNSPYSFETVPISPNLATYTEFELIDSGKLDIAFTFSATQTPHLLPAGKENTYYCKQLAPVQCLFRMPQTHPLAQVSRFRDVPSRGWPLVEDASPLLASAVEAVSRALDAVGFPHYNVNVRGASITPTLNLDNDYISVYFETALDASATIISQEGIIEKTFEDAPIMVYPFALCHADNTAATTFIDALAK